MYFKLKAEQYWVWSSKKASLDCLPWYKFDTIREMRLFFARKGKKVRVYNER